LFNIARSCAIAKGRGLPLQTFTTIAAVRTFLTTFSPSEIQFIFPSTGATFLTWTRQQKQTAFGSPSTSPLASGDLHWLAGQPHHIEPETKVLLFFHGGGYAVPLGPAHLKWCKRHIEVAQTAGIQLHVAVLEYDLSPAAHYPRQLQQAAFALEHILNLGFKPCSIVIGGDSAGGNLTFALLCHLLHPHPGVRKVELEAPLGGAFGISPWITMDLSTQSCKENKDIDMLSPSLVRQSGSDFLRGGSAGEPWTMALDCPAEWWSTLHTCINNLYLNIGQHEMFRDHVLSLAQTLQQVTSNRVAIYIDLGENEAHDHILAEFMMGNVDGRPFRSLTEWMLNLFKNLKH
jgi:acetyl esterase/lipase